MKQQGVQLCVDPLRAEQTLSQKMWERERFATAPPTAARRPSKSGKVVEIAQALLRQFATHSTARLIVPKQAGLKSALLRVDVNVV